MSREFEEFIDDAIDADFEYDDIIRVSKLLDAGDGIDHLDSEKLIPDFCSLRYKFIFMYMSFRLITLAGLARTIVSPPVVSPPP
jgi:hypothetical protein